MPKAEMIVTDRRFEWRQRAARHLLSIMGGEFDSWGGIRHGCHVDDNEREGAWMWYKIMGRPNVVPTDSFVEIFWPMRPIKVERYFTNHIWDICAKQRDLYWEKQIAESSD